MPRGRFRRHDAGLDSKVLIDDGSVAQLIGGDLRDDASLLNDQHTIGQALDDAQILLDQEEGEDLPTRIDQTTSGFSVRIRETAGAKLETSSGKN